MIVVGLMSGTSADGIDAAVVELDGAPPELRWKLLQHLLVPHPPELRAAIFAAFRPETGTVDRLCELNFALGRAFGRAALAAIEAASLSPAQVDLIGSHGQTVWHAPGGAEPSTLQLGEPAVIAEMTGAPVVNNFRARDMAAGGQGAPLVARVDELLFRHPSRTRALQNIGGIANVTYLPPAGNSEHTVLAFDTGPGNMLMDELARRATDGAWSYDRDGVLAHEGRVDAALLAELMADPYLALRPPKTTGRERFGAQYAEHLWRKGIEHGLSGADLVATATAFTAYSIADAYRRFLPAIPDEVIVSGGGAANPTLFAMLAQALQSLLPGKLTVITSEALGLPPEAKEAVAFAVLAHETWHGRPGNAPSATGAARSVVLGSVTPGETGEDRAPAWQKASSARTDAPRAAYFTEARNPATEYIDSLSTLDMVTAINREDQRVADAVGEQLEAIAQAIDAIAARMAQGGRLIYIGAGTSGRLGVLDASECPPTFSSPPGQVLGIIAGGSSALTDSAEGAEDDTEAGAADLLGVNLTASDSVVGIAASGRTPYVIGALRAARDRGALTVAIACNAPSEIGALADINIPLLVGPEVITGSTRLKAGSAQKMALNMLSTGVMIRLGKTYGNLMVDVQPTNVKLRERARRIVEMAAGVSADEAARALERCGGETKTAIVCLLRDVEPETARTLLRAAGGRVRGAVSA